MTPEMQLVRQLSDSSAKVDRTLSSFMKTAGDPGSAVRAMKESVKGMKQAVTKLPASPPRDLPKVIKTVQSKTKKASVDKLALADLWGRQLAREDYQQTAQALRMAKEAGLGQMAMGMLNRAGPAIGRGLSAVSKTPWVRRTAIGAGVGAGIGGVRHFLKPKNPQTGQRDGSMLGSMAGGAIIGGLGGLASKSIADHALSSQPVQDIMRGQWGAKKQQTAAQRMLPRPPVPASQQTVNAG